MMENRRYPRIGVAAFVVRDGLFAMGRRKGAHGEDTWSIPGGAIEWGESHRVAGCREVREEIGLCLSSLRTLGVTDNYNPSWDIHWYTIWLIGSSSDDQLLEREPDRFVDLGWYSLDNMPAPLFFPLKQLRFDPLWALLRQELAALTGM